MRFISRRIRLSAISSLFALALGASSFGPASVAAQEQAILWGVVSDAVTGEIVDSAAVTLVGTGIETRTADGIFEFPDAPLGLVTVRVQAPGYPAVVEEVEMTPGAVRIMQVVLPSVDAVLRELLVVPATNTAGSDGAGSAADLLARKVLGINMTEGNVGVHENPILLRGVTSINMTSEPAIFLDGIRMSGFGQALEVLRQIPANNVNGIRVLRGPAAAFIQGSANGAILIETKVGLGGDRQ